MRDRFTKNLGLKIVSLVLAVLLWYTISQKGMTEISMDVAIEYINIPQGFEIIKKDIDRVTLSVYGSEQILRTLKPGDIRVVVDLEGATPGERIYKIGKKNIRIPSALTVTDIKPSSVKVVLDKNIKKTVPVRVRFIDKFREDLYELRISPRVVELTGPSTMLKDIDFLYTEPLKASALTPEETVSVKLMDDFDKLQVSVKEVKITVVPKKDI
ncbi:MAG: hypothetical protein GXO99_06225 [Nitrospirae bacterium]|nr:hypothetical protein [Nitrospirota bacterium]